MRETRSRHNTKQQLVVDRHSRLSSGSKWIDTINSLFLSLSLPFPLSLLSTCSDKAINETCGLLLDQIRLVSWCTCVVVRLPVTNKSKPTSPETAVNNCSGYNLADWLNERNKTCKRVCESIWSSVSKQRISHGSFIIQMSAPNKSLFYFLEIFRRGKTTTFSLTCALIRQNFLHLLLWELNWRKKT